MITEDGSNYNGERPIYPRVRIKGDNSLLNFETYIRKRHNGVWYLWLVTRWMNERKITSADIISELQDFHEECYRVVLFGIVQPTLTDHRGRNIFPADEDQRDEADRLDYDTLDTR